MTPSPDIPENELRERCSTILMAAAEEARQLGHNFIGTEHLFIAASRNENGPVARLLRRANLNARDVRHQIRREIGGGEGTHEDVLPLTPRAEMVLALAIFLAEQDQMREIGEHHLLMAMLQEGEGVPIRKLIDMGFDLNLWLQRLIAEEHDPHADPLLGMSDLDDLLPDESDIDFDLELEPDFSPRGRGMSSTSGRSPTPLLDKYGRDLTVQARSGKLGPAIAREKEIRALARTLARSKKN
ncbi:MAG TPA: Clp protease N-terminal domain-containing protein, partial [Aggregatilineales bacterium]|nr:Clp protease N-terminal domain-containing protein [Aggregatilineales bacterium]